MNIINNISERQCNISEPLKAEKISNNKITEPAKGDILDIFSKKVINPKDINDMVEAPRSIFKGYLCFTAGASLTLIGSLIKNKTVNKAATILGSIISIIGTFNFVKPFLLKDKNLTKKEK